MEGQEQRVLEGISLDFEVRNEVIGSGSDVVLSPSPQSSSPLASTSLDSRKHSSGQGKEVAPPQSPPSSSPQPSVVVSSPAHRQSDLILPNHDIISDDIVQAEGEREEEEEVEDIVLYCNEHMLFSSLGEKKFRFALVWKDWAPRVVRIHSNGTLSHCRTTSVKPLPTHIFQLKNIEVTLMADASAMHEDYEDEENGEKVEQEHGLMVKCLTMDNIETYFRCILSVTELDKFLGALMNASGEHNLSKLTTTQIDVSFSPPVNKSNLAVNRMGVMAIGNLAESITNTIQNSVKRDYSNNSSNNKPTHTKKSSIMRRAIARAMDKYDQRSKLERVVARRGAFSWLPVIGSNDLIHGSWWFVIGSIGVVATTLVVIYNKYYLVLSDDDSTLTKNGFVATWLLLCISGVFSTLGSLAFVRAFHEDPPMRPMFPAFYHTQSDELLASWLFFFAMIPFIPYCLIFLSEERSHSLLYLIALIFAILVCLGSLLFVRACYPTDRVRRCKFNDLFDCSNNIFCR